jgi:hypothetical protein
MIIFKKRRRKMKTRTANFFLIALLVALAVLLSACQVNIITEIDKDGSGTYIQEIGFQGDEASMAGLGDSGDDFCAQQNTDLLPGTTIRQETRNEDETWCIYETPFASLDELRTYYSATDTWINDLSIQDGVLTYDIALDMSGDSGAPMGADMYWIVEMPGNVTNHNADEQDGNTLKWNLLLGAENNIYAVSEVGGLSLGGNTVWYILGGGAVLCLCCILPITIAVVVFVLVRRKKGQDGVEKPAEPIPSGEDDGGKVNG